MLLLRFCYYRSAISNLDLNVVKERHTNNSSQHLPPAYGYKLYLEQASAGASSSNQPTLSQSQKNAIATKQKSHAMSIATRPGQAILMNALMLYMSGSQLNIFSINTVSMAVFTPLASIFTLEQTFGHLSQKVDLQMPKLLFVGLNLAWLCLGLYKMSSMRLLPTTSADWTSKIPWKDVMESTSIPPDSTANTFYY